MPIGIHKLYNRGQESRRYDMVSIEDGRKNKKLERVEKKAWRARESPYGITNIYDHQFLWP